jgi:hypothetical protein
VCSSPKKDVWYRVTSSSTPGHAPSAAIELQKTGLPAAAAVGHRSSVRKAMHLPKLLPGRTRQKPPPCAGLILPENSR